MYASRNDITETISAVYDPEKLVEHQFKDAVESFLSNADYHIKEYKKEPNSRPASPISLVLLNVNKWVTDTSIMQDYCISVTFEHEKEIDLYNQIRTNIQTRIRI